MARSRTTSLIGMVVVFAVAYGFDRLAHYMREQLGATPSEVLYRGLLWVDSASLLVLAALLVALTWYVVFRSGRDWWVGGVFVVVGLFLSLVVAIEASLVSSTSVSDQVMKIVPFKSPAHQAAAFIAVIGIASLVVPRKRRAAA